MVDFIHPEDAAALDTLKKNPVLPAVIKAFMDLGAEQLQTGLNMASKVELSSLQFPVLIDNVHEMPSEIGVLVALCNNNYDVNSLFFIYLRNRFPS